MLSDRAKASSIASANLDENVVHGFGDEWERFDQAALREEELSEMCDNYFNIFPWEALPANAVGFDFGCGSGRWAKFVAPRVAQLHLIDASSSALKVAERNLAASTNCKFHLASAETIPLANDSADFGYSLGVLHHVPDTQQGLNNCVAKLRPGAPFLLYLYYSFDNRPAWFRTLWKVSDMARQLISRQNDSARWFLSEILALCVYWPLARTSLLLEKLGLDVGHFPLSWYRKRSLYVMRNDALDRFGTRLEQRFSKQEVRDIMERAGLENIRFSETSFWTAVGFRRSAE